MSQLLLVFIVSTNEGITKLTWMTWLHNEMFLLPEESHPSVADPEGVQGVWTPALLIRVQTMSLMQLQCQ